MTLIDPTTGSQPDPASADSEAWGALRGRARAMTQWTDKAVELASEAADRPPPGRLARWRGRRLAARAEAMTAARTIQLTTAQASRPAGSAQPARPDSGRLRYVPPVAALGTAFVLQVVAMTDVVGGELVSSASRSDVTALADHSELGYLAGMLLGIAVASCAEGGAAYLMDLYDKHLMARDSVWVLRLAMVGYVGVSAGVIHWWAAERHLPAIISWVLAGMSASALFLWSRGSRWRHRAAMRAADQLDPAMPRLSTAAKVLHPIRWIMTLYLVSWEPAATPDEARGRYERWVADRAEARRTKVADRPDEAADHLKATAGAAPGGVAAGSPTPSTDDDPAGQDDPTIRPPKPAHGPTAITDAAFLRETYGDDPGKLPGRNELWRRHGGNKERWTNAIKAYSDASRPTTRPDHP